MKALRSTVLWRVLIVLLCVLSTSWLIRYEAFPQWFTQRLDGYDSLMGRDVLITESWLRVFYNGEPVGYSRSHLDLDETDPRRRYLLQNELVLGFKIGGVQRMVGIDVETRLDTARRLQTVTVNAGLAGFDVRAEIRRAHGDMFDVNTSIGGVTNALSIRIPDDAIFFVPMSDMLARQLRVGRSLSVRVFDPSTLGTRNLVIYAVREETIETRDGPRQATVLEMEYHGVRTLSWVDRDGQVLRQEAGPGLVMEPCTPDEAFAALRDSEAGLDLMQIFTGDIFTLGGGR